MTSRFAFSTLVFPLLTLAIGCRGDDLPGGDEVGETGTGDTATDTATDDGQTESSDTADTSTDTTNDTTTTDSTTTDTDTTTDTTDTTETTDGNPVDADMDGSPADEDCDDADPLNFPGNTEVCDEQDNDCDGDADGGAVDGGIYYVDADMDGFGVGEGFNACEVPPGTSQVPGDCNDADPDAYPDAADACALGSSCRAIFESGAGDQDGVYLVDPAGVNAGGQPVEVWCDMTNGGLTAALVINSVMGGAYIGDFGGDYVSTELLAADPAQASGQGAQAVQAWLNLNEYDYVDFRLEAYSDEASTFISGWIARTSLRIEFGQAGYLLYAEPNNLYSWCGGPASFTDGGVGQVNKPVGAPNDCKGHVSLGSGWDFSLFGNAGQFNLGLTLCGGDASTWMFRNYGNTELFYPTPGAAYVVWTR